MSPGPEGTSAAFHLHLDWFWGTPERVSTCTELNSPHDPPGACSAPAETQRTNSSRPRAGPGGAGHLPAPERAPGAQVTTPSTGPRGGGGTAGGRTWAQSCTEHHKPCRREKVPLGITLMGELSRGNGFSKCIYISTYHSSKWLDNGGRQSSI